MSVFSLRSCLEVMAEVSQKVRALQQVAESLGYRLNDCIAFGDGMNDRREMLENGRKRLHYGGAHQRLKDILPEMEVIGSNADDAVCSLSAPVISAVIFYIQINKKPPENKSAAFFSEIIRKIRGTATHRAASR